MKDDLQADAAPAGRIASIDALRGLVIFTMIYVNDIAGVDSRIVPAWMRHFQGPSGMTFVDLVFPAFLFVMGMSVPVAVNARLARGEPPWKCLLHIVIRTLSLLLIGIMIVNGSPDSQKMGWSATLWSALMFVSAIFAFSSLALPGREQISRVVTVVLRVFGLASLVLLALAFRGSDGHRILSLSPFSITTRWYGINKNQATPSWCLWACAITAAPWLLFYLLADVRPQSLGSKFAKPFAVAGSNVLLAYLLSEAHGSALGLVGLGGWYSRLAQPDLAHAMARSIGCAIVILAVTAGLNRLGFRLKL